MLCAVLSACGGGGGGGSSGLPASLPAFVPGVVDGAATVATLPVDSASGVKRDGLVVTITPTVTAGTFTSNTTTTGLVCDGNPIVTADQAVLGGQVLTLTPSADKPPPYGSTCVAQGQVLASGANGGMQATVAWKTTFTIEQAPASSSASGCATPQVAATVGPFHVCAYPMGSPVLGSQFQQLPADCTSANVDPSDPSSGFSACWSDFVNAGKVMWVQSSATMVGLLNADGTPDSRSTRPLIYGGFISGAGDSQIRQFYADTGELFNLFSLGDTDSTANNIRSVTGNQLGYLLVSGTPPTCMQWYFEPTTGGAHGAEIWHYWTLDIWAEKLPGVTPPTCGG